MSKSNKKKSKTKGKAQNRPHSEPVPESEPEPEHVPLSATEPGPEPRNVPQAATEPGPEPRNVPKSATRPEPGTMLEDDKKPSTSSSSLQRSTTSGYSARRRLSELKNYPKAEQKEIPQEPAYEIPAIACRGLDFKDLSMTVANHGFKYFSCVSESSNVHQPSHSSLTMDNTKKPGTSRDPRNRRPHKGRRRSEVDKCPTSRPEKEEKNQPMASATTQELSRPPMPKEHPVDKDKEKAMSAITEAISMCRSSLNSLEQQMCSMSLDSLFREVGEGIPASEEAGPAEEPTPECSQDRKFGGVAEAAKRDETTAATEEEVSKQAEASGAAVVLCDDQDDLKETDIPYSTVAQRIFRLSLEGMNQASSLATQMLGASQENNPNPFCTLEKTLEVFENLVKSITELRVYLEHFSKPQMAGRDETRMLPEGEQPDDHDFDNSQKGERPDAP